MALDYLTKKQSRRMLNPLGTALAAIAIGAEQAARRNAAEMLFPDELEKPLTGTLAAGMMVQAVRRMLLANPRPGWRPRRSGDAWVELLIHGRLRVHLNRGGIDAPASDSQRQRLEQPSSQHMISELESAGQVTNIEFVTCLDDDGVSRANFQFVGDPTSTWTEECDLAAARRQLNRWIGAEVDWVSRFEVRRPAGVPLLPPVAGAAMPTSLGRPQPTTARRFTVRPREAQQHLDLG